MQGEYRDRVVGPRGRVRADSGWARNRIAESAWPLLAGLLKGDPALGGIRYLALGEGRAAWDRGERLATPETRLVSEVHRAPVEPDDRSYLEPDGTTADTPTERLELRVTLPGARMPGPLREFGLVGGDATGESDTGLLVNHVTHRRIDLGPGDTLVRQVRLVLRPQPRWLHAPRHWLAQAPADVLVGIARAHAAALRGQGVDTVGEVAEMEPTRLRGVPFVPLVQLRAKARLALRTAAGLRVPAPLHDHSAWEVISTPASDLAGDADVAVEEAERVREQVGALEVTLNHDYLRGLTVGTLLAGPPDGRRDVPG